MVSPSYDSDRVAAVARRLVALAIALLSVLALAAAALAWAPGLPDAVRISPAAGTAFLAATVIILAVLCGAWRAQSEIAEAAGLLAKENVRLARGEQVLLAAKDEAERDNRGKAEFLAQLSHEIRTPMNAIVGFGELLGAEAYGPLGNPRYREYATHIQTSAQHLLNLTNDILDLSRAEIGRLDLAESGVDVGATIAFAVRMLAKEATAGGVGVEWKMPDGSLTLLADERRLRQMLINVVNNAIKFTPDGGAVFASALRRPDGGVTIRVSDSGIGIAPADVEKALRPFTKLKTSMVRSYEGAGIGLALTRQLVELHGGRIVLDSEPGKGTTVNLLFPKERTIEADGTEDAAERAQAPNGA